MNRHAYLIMAHGNWDILKKLILLIDDEKNDIYLHIDAKAIAFPKEIKDMVHKSKLVLVGSQKVFWADYSIAQVELKLLTEARNSEKYSYYHLLSGVDLPIKSIRQIYHFFENSGKNFIGIVPNEVYYSVRRVKFYHMLVSNQYYRNMKILKVIDRVSEYMQSIFGVNRLKDTDWKIIDGWQWFSITDEFCNYIIENRKKIEKMFSYTVSCDELFVQTLAYNSEFYTTLYDTSDLKNGSMRYIDWTRGKPYNWGKSAEDYNLLMESPYMFARKFDENHMDLVNRIFEEIDRRNKNEE